MGTIGVDIRAIHIVEKHAGVAINDFVVELPADQTADSLVSVCHSIEGVKVEWVAAHPTGGNLQSDLETASQMVAQPREAARILAEAAPLLLGAAWAMLLNIADEPAVIFGTPEAPQPSSAALAELGPYDNAHLVVMSDGWFPDGDAGSAAVVPLIGQQVLVVARPGPRFREPELVRLTHLATLVG